MIRIGNAPTSWGIETAADPAAPPAGRVLDEIAAAGYQGTELGPYGFLPTDPAELTRELSARDLALTGGTVMRSFHDVAQRTDILQATAHTVELLASQSAPYLVLISGWDDRRLSTAGRADAAERLNDEQFDTWSTTVGMVAEIARNAGVEPVLHPHAGTHLEFQDELDRVVERFAPEEVSLCVDTGHLAYGGMDPLAVLDRLGDRITYIHLKDISLEVLARVRHERLGFWDAYRLGVFVPLGQGSNDFRAIGAAVRGRGYAGWVTVEQDADPRGRSDPHADAVQSLEHIRRIGFVDGIPARPEPRGAA